MSMAPKELEIPDELDFNERFKEQNRVSRLMESCMMDDDEAKEELGVYEQYARTVCLHIRVLGISQDGGRLLPSSLARKCCYMIDKKSTMNGKDVLDAIKRMANGEVYVERDTTPHSLFFPEKTVNKINRMELRGENNEPIMQSDITKIGEKTITD